MFPCTSPWVSTTGLSCAAGVPAVGQLRRGDDSATRWGKKRRTGALRRSLSHKRAVAPPRRMPTPHGPNALPTAYPPRLLQKQQLWQLQLEAPCRSSAAGAEMTAPLRAASVPPSCRGPTRPPICAQRCAPTAHRGTAPSASPESWCTRRERRPKGACGIRT